MLNNGYIIDKEEINHSERRKIMTAAQRINARQDKIWEECLKLKREADKKAKAEGKEITTYWDLSEEEDN